MDDVATAPCREDRRFTALVVDDDSFSRGTAMRLLRVLGAGTVMEAADGEQALSCFAALDVPPDVILCDLRMPSLDGIEVIRVLAAWGSDVPIILVSSTDPRILHSAQQVATDLDTPSLRTIPKPLTMKNLSEALSDAGIPLLTTEPGNQGQIPSRQCGGAASGALSHHPGPGLRFHPRVRLASGFVAGAQLVQTQGGSQPRRDISAGSDPARSILASFAGCLPGWLEAGGGYTLGFSLPAGCMGSPDLPRRVEAVASAAGISPGQLTFGIPVEGWHAHATARELVVHFSLMGFRLRLEGFGAELCSHLLLEAPFDELGIDPALARAATTNTQAAATLAAGIAIAAKLGATVDCGGIQTRDEQLFLHRAGCDTGWGSAIAETVDVQSLASWVKADPTFGAGGITPLR